MSNDPFIAQPKLLAAIDAWCDAHDATVDQLAAKVHAMADWTRPITGASINAMVRGTLVPSGALAAAVAAVVGGSASELFEVHPDVARLLHGQRLVDEQ